MKHNINSSMDETSILGVLQNDEDAANVVKEQVMSEVDNWWFLYDGGQYSKGMSQITMSDFPAQKDIMRVVESSLPDITSPFITEDDLIEIQPKTAESVIPAEIMTKLINQQFRKGIDKLEFMETIGRNIQVEGTTFCKVGWGDDGPIVENVPISELMLDPSARRMKDLRYAIQKSKVSRIEMLENPEWYGELTAEDFNTMEVSGGSDTDEIRGMRDDSFNFDDDDRELFDLCEYYGMLDIGNGFEPVLCIYSGNKLLKAEPSPYPASWKGIPFEAAVYTRIPFSIYGDSIAELLSGSQRFRQLIRTGMVEDIANSTSGQIHIKKGALDPMNRKAFTNGKRIVEWNMHPAESMVTGEFGVINPSIFQLNETLHMEQDDLSGVSRMNVGMDPRSLNSNVSATAVSTANNNSQKRLLQITRHISEMLERVFTKWIDLNQELLEEAMVTDGSDYIPVNRERVRGHFNINVIAGTTGMKQTKIQSLQMMMTQLIPMAGSLPKELTMGLTAQMASLMEMPKLAEELRTLANQPDEPSPEQELMLQLEMAEKEAAIAKDKASAMKYTAEAMGEHTDTELKSYGIGV